VGRAADRRVSIDDGAPGQAGDRIDSSHFLGLDVPAIGGAIAATSPDVVLIPDGTR
jgi:hypothetical protein